MGATNLGGAPADTARNGTQSNGDNRAEEVARDLAKLEARRKYNREWKKRHAAGLIGTRASQPEPIASEPATETPEPSPTPNAPDFQVNESGPSARRSYTRKPKVDPEQINLIAQSVQLVINGLATAFVGPDGEMQAHEEKGIVEPLTRILSKLQPETITAVQMFSDPATLLVFAAMYGSRLMAIYRDQNSRGGRRPGSPPPSQAPSPPGATQETFQDQVKVDNNGHLTEAPPVVVEPYRGSSVI